MIEVAPGTIQVWSDIGCPWSHAVVWRLHDARRRLGLDDRVAFDHRAFPLELFNNEPTPRARFDSEWPLAEPLAPRAGWQAWEAAADAWPVTMLPAMEAVRAAKEQSLAASEELDRGLRRAFFGESRCISLRHVILEVASTCESVDINLLAEAMDDGRARAGLIADWALAGRGAARGSAHLFLPDGGEAQNPGLTIDWDEAAGALRVADDGGAAIEDFVRRAAAGASARG